VSLPFLDPGAVSVSAAADALEAALAGLDPEVQPARTIVPAGAGELLVMPAAVGPVAAVKLVSVGPSEPRIQGVCVLFDAATLAPAALVDGIALTNLRTPAVSLVAVRRLAAPDARRLVVFGRGPQARAHADALRAIIGRGPQAGAHAEAPESDDVVLLGRDDPRRDELVAAADVICCCTTAREPLFDGSLVADHACVVAIGSHEPAARETDDRLAARATVVVESRASALREAGDVIGAVESGALAADELVTLRELVGGAEIPPGPRLFKSTGMAWEDAVVAGALYGARSS
jgi:ornithine cyclodeaminase/alanine dehydrogenase-like protein (mu-crystallin family)